MRTVILLVASNVFMTFAWYFHLKQEGWPLWKAIILSWFIAFFEYLFMIPANKYGKVDGFNLFQLKTIQEIITLVVFAAFAIIVMKEPFHWKYIIYYQFSISACGSLFYVYQKIWLSLIR